MKIKRFSGFNPSVIIQGKVVHQTGPLIPKEGEVPRFSQLYCCDPNLEKSQRFENLLLPEKTSAKDKRDLKKLLEILQGEIRKANPFIKDFMMIMEIPDEDLANGKIIISAISIKNQFQKGKKLEFEIVWHLIRIKVLGMP